VLLETPVEYRFTDAETSGSQPPVSSELPQHRDDRRSLRFPNRFPVRPVDVFYAVAKIIRQILRCNRIPLLWTWSRSSTDMKRLRRQGNSRPAANSRLWGNAWSPPWSSDPFRGCPFS
jgi:hypothetical protein